jgi:hypothetical protein
MAEKMPGKTNEGKRKNNDRNHHNSNGGRSITRQENTNHGGRGRGRGGRGGRGNNSDHLKNVECFNCGNGRGGRGNNSDHLKNVECFNCGKKGHYSTDCSLQRKNDNEQSNMVSKADFKNLFQSSLKEMLTNKEKQAKKNAEGDDDSLDMNVFEKLMEGKHTNIVNKSNDDLISINDTDTFDYYIQDKMINKSCEDNNYNDNYDELAYPFSKKIKLKHEPEKAQENVPVQYTADIIVEVKNRDGTVVPMRALLDTGTTTTIILR